ncbi:MAG: MotA/TolQ/ExbB proton channel family protein [Proteobacteria bacterium]|nr:MotA/TolQ/ExbB proton channel family protein [Pseudomonadota bacterium]
MFSAEHLLELFQMGWISNYPLTLGSIVTICVFAERLWVLRGLEKRSRALTAKVTDALVQRDVGAAREACEADDTPLGRIFQEGLKWQNVAIEDLERILATARAEAAASLRRGIWMIGTVGSLAPFVGLFGTVVGIIRAFADMAAHGSGGFAVVANGISEALIATAAGLGVAIVALSFFNYLQTRIGSITATFGRGSERFVQALIYVESSSEGGEEASDGHFQPA